METKIKLIWDFRGPSAQAIARHHLAHLREYIVSEGLDITITGQKELSDLHSLAYMVVQESQMPEIRDRLRPHRGELYDD